MAEASTDYFITLVECNRIIYDKSSKDFKNIPKKEEAWARIALNSKMTVEGAKKRYVALRQKYCREKQKIEIQRRTKSKPMKPWTYYERLHFLDDFIQPRSTYTNDTGFEEIEATIYSEPVMGTGDDASLSVATDYAMATDYLNDAQNENAELSRQSNELIVTYNPEDVQGQGSYEFVDNLENNSTMILSEYSGQLSTFQAPASYLPSTTQSVCGIATASADSGPDTTRDKEQFTRNSVNLSRNVRSPPGFARSTRVGVNASSSHKGPKLPLRTNAPTMSTSSSSKAPQATTTSSPTDRNMEAMQNKLSSCISALSTKVTEKQNRSPHAPFLAYLGTKLPNVPKEELAALEKEILNLVDSFCR